MVWVNGCPQFLINVPVTEEILDLIDIPHTPLLGVLTKTSVFIFNQFTLLPLGSHVRNLKSIESDGSNMQMKTKHVSVNTAKFQKLNTVNLFIQTDLNFLIIYQISINYSSSIYEVHNKNDELIQNGLPLSFTPLGFSITNFFKSATKTIIHGSEDISINLENIENANNCPIEDDIGGLNIEPIKLSIFKILKIGIGLKDFWLQQNSHNLYIFNNHDEKNHDISTEKDDDYLQMVNILNFKTKLFHFLDFAWYNNCKITFITYNEFLNYFLFVNKKNEIWYMTLEDEKDHVYKIGTGENIDNIWFNPQTNLLVVKQEGLKLYSIKHKQLNFLKDLDIEEGEVEWSPCGEFFKLINKSDNSWKLLSKFGNIKFDSQQVLNELDESNDTNRDFLKATMITIAGNGSTLYVLNKTKLFYVSLNKSDGPILYNKEYMTIIQNNKDIIRFPMLARFKKILLNQEHFNGKVNQHKKSESGKLTFSRSLHNQLAIAYGDYLSVSTPYSQGDKIDHIIWFNFRNHFADSLNIVHQFWFQDYLIVINRRSRIVFEENDEDDKDHLVDEFIVLDASRTKFGMGGEDISFTSDSLLWKYDFKSTFINVHLSNDKNNTGQVVILTADHRLIVLQLATDKMVKTDTEIKHYKIFISVNKTVHLSSISHRIDLDAVIQTSMINNRHFLFLLATGDFYLLKNQSRPLIHTPAQAVKPTSNNNNNMYDLIKLHSSIEFFKFKSIKFENDLRFIYLFNGKQVLIYEIDEMIEKAYDKTKKHPDEVLDFDDEEDALIPITIDTDGMQPFEFDAMLDNKSLDLIGLETLAIDKQTAGGLIIRNRISHKLILNNFIEFDLLHKGDLESSFKKYKHFRSFHYCLELLLFKHLTDEKCLPLKRLFQLIEFTDNSEFIYINCLRKIEIGYWNTFFNVLETTPEDFMNRLIEIDNVELCYNYLIIYLNYKHEDEKSSKDQLSEVDKEIILKIITMLTRAGKWDWCFELCRFVKILEHSDEFLKQIKQELE